ncbi:MAG: twitching motility protein PilT [Lachnospiraceae bacterium]|nr:twitching motility protein PilT [Lachnospiraceae bacterium]
MVQIIAGAKGKGKTKILLDKVNANVANSKGTIVYLDKNTKHMYELDKNVRLINGSEYFITNYDEFVGFVCGLVSQDHDLETVYLDSFLNLACIEGTDTDIAPIVKKLDLISAKFGVNFVLSVSLDINQISEDIKSMVIVAL